MTTYRELVNRTLVALGHADDLVDDAATEITDAYQIKVAEWVNDFLEEVEDAAQWRVLRQRDTATVLAGALSATLTNSTERSKPFYVVNQDAGGVVPICFDVTDTANFHQLREVDLAELLFLDQQNAQFNNGVTIPMYFALNATAAGAEIFIWPRCAANVSVEIDMIIPQARIPYDTLTDLDTVVKVPGVPVVLGAIWWAQEDRGEELGSNGEKTEQRYREKLAELVSRENATQGFDELVVS